MCHNLQVVLIGDHKQLRPVVKNVSVKKLGMAKSSFERHFEIHKKHAVMLDTQYRMVRMQNTLTPSLVAGSQTSLQVLWKPDSGLNFSVFLQGKKPFLMRLMDVGLLLNRTPAFSI